MSVTPYFLPYQNRWLLDDSPLKLWEKSRRIGATYGSGYRSTVKKCARRKKFTQWVSSRDLLTARELITDYVALWCRALNIAAANLDEPVLEVVDPKRDIGAYVVRFANGSRIVSLSSTPEAFAGKGGDVLLDELALHEDPEKLLTMAIPCTTWGGQVEVLSAYPADATPGSDYFGKLCRDAREGGNPMGWSLHRTTIDDALAEGLAAQVALVSKRPDLTSESFRATLRARCVSEDAWRSQYLCQPVVGAAALLPYELIAGCEAASLQPLAALGERARLVLGVDVGRKKDLTVLILLEEIGDILWLREIRVLEKAPFHAQLDVLLAYARDPRVRRVAIDATGLGLMLAEELGRLSPTQVEEVTFTNTVKADLAPRVLRAFQDRSVRIPGLADLREDLHKVQKTVTAAGHVRYAGERDEDGHSDRFWALALALYAATDSNSVVGGERLPATDRYAKPATDDGDLALHDVHSRAAGW